MVQLAILSGKQAGTFWGARRFPVQIGRAPDNDLRLEEDGVFDCHLQLQLRRQEGFILTAQAPAFVSVNGQSVQEALLRNGDTIELGGAKLQFWFGDAQQFGLAARESLAWVGVALVFLAQTGLVYWLLRQA